MDLLLVPDISLHQSSDGDHHCRNILLLQSFIIDLFCVFQVQEGNNLCQSGIERKTLELLCEKYSEVHIVEKN